MSKLKQLLEGVDVEWLHSVRNVTLGKKYKITTEPHSVRNAS